MADKVKTVRGTVAGATVETSEENATRLGSAFEPEKKTAAKTTAAKKASAKPDTDKS